MISIERVEELIEQAFDNSIEDYRVQRKLLHKDSGKRIKLWLEATFVSNFFHHLVELTEKSEELLVLVGPQWVEWTGKWKVPDLVIYRNWTAIIAFEFKIYPIKNKGKQDLKKLRTYRRAWNLERGYFIHIDHLLKTFKTGAKFEKGYYREFSANMSENKKVYC